MSNHDGVPAERTPEELLADHTAIDRLADELLPALVAKLGASGLGELDVREGAWRVRLRMPGDARGTRRTAAGGRAPGRTEPHASTPGQAGAGVSTHATSHAPGAHAQPHAPGGHVQDGHAAAAGAADAGAGTRAAEDPAEPPTRAVATSPAVGFFRPRADLAAGARVRSGDRLGMVDVLGVPQEVVAPADGLVGASFVEPGDPVEYGQEIVEIEILAAPAAASGPAPFPASAPPAALAAAPAPVAAPGPTSPPAVPHGEGG